MNTSIAHSTPAPQPQFRTVEEIVKANCPICGYDLDVTTAYSKGVPYVVCSNPNGGYTHLRVQITDELMLERDDFLHWQETAFGVWEEDMSEEEVA